MSAPHRLLPETVGRPLHVDPDRGAVVTARVEALVGQVKSVYVELCPLLAEVYREQYYQALSHSQTGQPYTSFVEYCEDRLGWGERKVGYLLAIHTKLHVEGGLPEQELRTLDWSKAAALTALPAAERTPAKLPVWVAKARTLPVAALKADVGRVKNKALGRKQFQEEEFAQVQFFLAPAQAKNLHLAVEVAQQLTGTKTRAWAIDCIATYFLGGHLEDSGEALQQICRNVERAFGVHIVAVRKNDEEIAYGEKVARVMEREAEACAKKGKQA